jgi:bleomycin hydrolase
VPESFEYKGRTYTPKTFAEKVVGLNANDYVEMSAFQYAPLYKPTMLMVPDNWSLQSIWNIKMKEMTEAVDNALERGYSVAWATDVSERYFSWKNGVAVVPEKDYVAMTPTERKTMFDGPKPERTITAKDREDAFDNYTTTDDHGMHIVGLAKDQNGTEYYMVKNSWGDKNDYKGYLYVSKTFFEYKTTAILMNKNALPKGLKRNLGI